MDRRVSLTQPIIRTNVQSGSGLSSGCFRQEHCRRRLKRTSYLNPKIHIHGRLAVRRVVIKKHIVAIAPQTRVLLQEFPNLV